MVNAVKVICCIVVFEFMYHQYEVVKRNFNNGYPLRQQRIMPLLIRVSIFTVSLMFISIKAKLFLAIIIFLYWGGVIKHIENQILPKYKNNPQLHEFYVCEIDELKNKFFIIAPICFIIVLMALITSK